MQFLISISLRALGNSPYDGRQLSIVCRENILKLQKWKMKRQK